MIFPVATNVTSFRSFRSFLALSESNAADAVLNYIIINLSIMSDLSH